MAGAGSRSRERVPTIEEVKESGYSNIMQTLFGDSTYLFAVKDSVQVELASMGASELRTWAIQNMASIRVFETNARGRITRELNRRDISELPFPEEVAAQAPVEAARISRSATVRADQIMHAIESNDFGSVTYAGPGGTRLKLSDLLDDAAKDYLVRALQSASDAEKAFFRDLLISFFEYAGTGRAGMELFAELAKTMAAEDVDMHAEDSSSFLSFVAFYQYAKDKGGALASHMRRFDRAYEQFWATEEHVYNPPRPRVPASAAPEEAAPTEAAAQAAPAEERMRLGKDTNPRTRQIVRALESGTMRSPESEAYEGINFPATGNARAEFFQQFSAQERQFLQRAWDFAGTKERELFAAELNAFFAEAGDGRMGMLTLAKILQRMASDYSSHQGAYAQARFFTIADFYYYASNIMEGEKTVGGAREHSIGSIGRAMKGAIGRRYQRLVDELKEERRAAIVRRLPGLEQVPTPAEAAPVEAAPEAAVEAAQAEAAVEAAQVQAPSALDWMYAQYSQVEFYQHLISRLPDGSPQLQNMVASMRAAEDRFLQFVQEQPQDVQDAARWRVQRINDRRAAELSTPVAGVPVAAAPVAAEPVPVEAALVAAPVEVYDYAKFIQIADRLDALIPREYDLYAPDMFDVPEFGEEVHGLYMEVQAHFADIDAILARGGLTDIQKTFLTKLKAAVGSALAAAE